MLTLTNKQQWLLGGVLLSVMLITRSNAAFHLADASWAIFFLAGFYLRSFHAFGIFMVAAIGVDYVSMSQSGNDFCLTSAYAGIIPAYGALFAAGYWFSRQFDGETWSNLFKLGIAVVLGFSVSEIISSGSFYLFSGYFNEISFAEFGGRLLKYAPHGLMIMSMYVAFAALLHMAITHFSTQRDSAA